MSQAVLHSILVVGGNGFVGSAVCRAALARGMQVTSISQSGRPYTTPKGHSPAWTSKVDWQAADALQPESYAHLLSGKAAVVHTLGTLLEDTQYKAALKDGNVPALLATFASGLLGGHSRNPLEQNDARGKTGSYEILNRDAALRVCEAFMSSSPPEHSEGPRPFVYVSAEDIFRPLISARYIETKREAEQRIDSMFTERPGFRAVHIRPSLIYHPHFRPLTSPIAALLDLSATLHRRVPPGVPTPSGVLRALSAALPPTAAAQTPATTSPLDSVANALTIPPIHVDHVAEAICIAADQARSDVSGVVGVQEMRELIGWSQKGEPQPNAPVHEHINI
ncbi:mitochondrial protein [Amylocystis lapponica]|nr:mitochondrial protein [Amylocystis lapponica]